MTFKNRGGRSRLGVTTRMPGWPTYWDSLMWFSYIKGLPQRMIRPRSLADPLVLPKNLKSLNNPVEGAEV